MQAQPPDHLDARLASCFHKDRPSDFAPRFEDRDAWERRASELRRQVRLALGLWPMPPRPAVQALITGRTECDGYAIENLYFASCPGHYVTGNLYHPIGVSGRRPAVLFPYGHWPDGRFWWRSDERIEQEIGSGAEATRGSARSPVQAACAMLARMGCLVLHYDMVGYGDSTTIEHGRGFLDAEAVLRLHSFMGLQTWNSVRALDLLTGRQDVDPARIGAAGGSGGATQAITLAAVDEPARLAAIFPSGMVSMNMQGGCVCENAPLLRVGTNNVELAALAAPTPLALACAEDWTRDFLARGFPQLRSIYQLYDAEDRVTAEHFPFPHNFNLHTRRMMYDFFNRWLKLGWSEPVREIELDPLPPDRLRVFDGKKPRPMDETDAAGVRRWMSESSDRGLDEQLRTDPDVHARVVRDALWSMIGDAAVTGGDVQVIESTGDMPRGGGHWQGIIGRAGTGERIPAAADFPAGWDGTVLLWAHPNGVASLDEHASEVRRVLSAGWAVVAIDGFGLDRFGGASLVERVPPPSRPNPRYAGYWLGYNRCELAERARDLLTAVALIRGWPGVQAVHLLATAVAGPGALIARALAAETVDRVAIDLGGFDFERIERDDDPLLLPGAVKYGGVAGLARLFPARPALLCGVRKSLEHPAVQCFMDSGQLAGLIEWMVGPKRFAADVS